MITRVQKNLFLKDIISPLISFNEYMKAARMSLMHQSFVSLGLPSRSLFIRYPQISYITLNAVNEF